MDYRLARPPTKIVILLASTSWYFRPYTYAPPYTLVQGGVGLYFSVRIHVPCVNVIYVL